MKLKTVSLTIAIIVLLVFLGVLAFKEFFPYYNLETKIDFQTTQTVASDLQDQLNTLLAAIEAYKQIGERPELDLYIVAARKAYYLGDLAKAREIYEEYFTYNSINPPSWDTYGNILRKMGDYKGAEKAYKKAIELKPEMEEYYRDLIDLYKDVWPEEKNNEIKQLIEQNIENKGRTRWNMVMMGNWYLDNGNCQAAENYYQQALQLALEDNDNVREGIKAIIKQAKEQCRE